MARGTNEFAGTDADDAGSPIGPVDPASLVSGGGSGGGTGSGNAGAGSDNSDDEFDPSIHAGRDKRNADGSFTRKRGRKSAGNNQRKAGAKDTVNLAGLEAILLSMHGMMAGFTGVQELALDQSEAAMLAAAAGEVAKHYPMTIDPKTLAWVNLATAAGMVYGPRVYLINARKKKEAKEEKERKAQSGPMFPGLGVVQ